MPYKTVNDLPPQVKVLPKLAQLMWLRVFNRTYKTKTEEIAIKTAWNIVKQFYKKNKDGKWIKSR